LASLVIESFIILAAPFCPDSAHNYSGLDTGFSQCLQLPL
jgi:hypothetical protein